MELTQSLKTCMRKYVTFSGRASRSEFWFFILAIFLLSAVASILDSIIFGPQVNMVFKLQQNSSGEMSQSIIQNTHYGSGWISNILGILTFLPSISVGWRRMHDIGRPGWYPLALVGIVTALLAVTLLAFQVEVPVSEAARASMPLLPETMMLPRPPAPLIITTILGAFGSFFLIIWWLTRPSQTHSNKFGPNPHEVTP